MPRGPKGEKRPADVIGNAVFVMRVAQLSYYPFPKGACLAEQRIFGDGPLAVLG